MSLCAAYILQLASLLRVVRTRLVRRRLSDIGRGAVFVGGALQIHFRDLHQPWTRLSLAAWSLVLGVAGRLMPNGSYYRELRGTSLEPRRKRPEVQRAPSLNAHALVARAAKAKEGGPINTAAGAAARSSVACAMELAGHCSCTLTQ